MTSKDEKTTVDERTTVYTTNSSSSSPPSQTSSPALATTSTNNQLKPGTWYLCVNNPTCQFKNTSFDILCQHIAECKFNKDNPPQKIIYQCPNCVFRSSLQELGAHISSCKENQNRKVIYNIPKAAVENIRKPVNKVAPQTCPTITPTRIISNNGRVTVTSSIMAPAAQSTTTTTTSPRNLPTCTICKDEFAEATQLINHMSTVHKMKASYKCSTCYKPFGSKEAVEHHIKDSHPTSSSNRSPRPTILATQSSTKSQSLLQPAQNAITGSPLNSANRAVNNSSPSIQQVKHPGGEPRKILPKPPVTLPATIIALPSTPISSTVVIRQGQVFRQSGQQSLISAKKPIEAGLIGQPKVAGLVSAVTSPRPSSPKKTPQKLEVKTENPPKNVTHAVRAPTTMPISKEETKPAESAELVVGGDMDDDSNEAAMVVEPDLPPALDLGCGETFEQNDIEVECTDRLTCTICGSEFDSIDALEEHEQTCPNGESIVDEESRYQMIRSPEQLPAKPDRGPDYFEKYTQEQINLVTDRDNVECKNCSRPFTDVISICSHLSRKVECREWYCCNLKQELIRAEERRKKLNLPRPPPLPPKQFNRLGNSSNVSSPGSSRPSPCQSPASNVGSARKGGKPLGVQMPLSNRLTRCSKCKKVFGGKSPFVAFRNHLRGAPLCAEHSMKPEIIVQQNVVEAFQKQFESQSTNVLRSPVNKQNLQSIPRSRNMKDPQQAGKIPTRESIISGTRFYCKLCEKIEYRSRVQLGVHLTQYHGLPPVNCDPDKKNEMFRCQNCHKIFNTKYYYNCHRRDCDINSPYIGAIDEEGNVITTKQQLDAAEERADNFPRSAPRIETGDGLLVANRSGLPPTQKELQVMNNKKPSAYFNHRYKCSLCQKVGFNGPNAVKIHQKYQCVNRSLNTHPTGSLAGIRKNPSQNRRPYQLPIPNRLKLEGYGFENDDPTLLPNIAEDPTSTMMDYQDRYVPNQCELCGKGPYRSYHYYQEHKKLFCKQNPTRLGTTGATNRSEENSLLLPIRAGKTTTKTRPIPQMTTTRIAQQVARKSLGSTPLIDDSVLEEEEMPEMPEYIDQIVLCLVCEEEFSDLDKFVFHRLRHINDNLKKKYEESASQNKRIEETDIEEHVCEICGAKLYGEKQMQPHLLLHLQNFKVRKNLLLEQTRRRQEDLNDEEDELICPHCQAEFTSRTEYKKHVRSTCPRKFRCSLCERSYLNEGALKRHRGQCIREAQLQNGKPRTKNQCRNCALTFEDQNQLMWHVQACPKIYSADLAGRMEAVIQRALMCSICGMTSDGYDNKVVHEKRCLQRFFIDVGVRQTTEEDTMSDIAPYVPSSVGSAISSMDAEHEVDQELADSLKERKGVKRTASLVLSRDDDVVEQRKKTMYNASSSDTERLRVLRINFLKLIDLLIEDEEFRADVTDEVRADDVLEKMLRQFCDEPVKFAAGGNELNSFRENLRKFLNFVIRKDTLEKAMHKSESIDEALHNLLVFPYPLKNEHVLKNPIKQD